MSLGSRVLLWAVASSRGGGEDQRFSPRFQRRPSGNKTAQEGGILCLHSQAGEKFPEHRSSGAPGFPSSAHCPWSSVYTLPWEAAGFSFALGFEAHQRAEALPTTPPPPPTGGEGLAVPPGGMLGPDSLLPPPPARLSKLRQDPPSAQQQPPVHLRHSSLQPRVHLHRECPPPRQEPFSSTDPSSRAGPRAELLGNSGL